MLSLLENGVAIALWRVVTRRAQSVGSLLERYTCCWTAIFIALLLLPSLFYGFDVTDGGFHVSQGVLVFHEGLAAAPKSNLTFLTSYFSGAVTYFMQSLGFGLSGLRVVWMIFFIFPIVLSIHLLRKLLGSHWLLPFIGLAAAASNSIYTTVLDYEKTPAFFAAVFLYFLYRTYEGKMPQFRPTYAAGLGVAFLLVLLSRVTMIPLLAVFLAPAFFAVRHAAIRKNVAAQLAGFTIAAVIFLLMLDHAGSLNAFFTHRNVVGGHSAGELLQTIVQQLRDYAAKQIIGLLILVPTLIVLAYRTKQTLLFMLLLSTTILFAAPSLYWAHVLMGRSFAFVLGTVITLCTYFLQPKGTKQAHPFFLPLLVSAALLLPAAQGGGSDSGIIRFASGGWLVVCLSVVLLMNAALHQRTTSIRRNLYALALAATLVYFLSGFEAFHRYPYADNFDRRTMTATFTHPQLKGIRSTPGRVESFQELINAIDTNKSNRSDRLLVYNNLPMTFYATRTYPLFDHTWITCISKEATTKVAEEVCTSPETTPGLIVRTKVEVRNGTWGNNPKDPIIEDDILEARTKMQILDKGIKKCRAAVIWENHDFQILRPVAAPGKAGSGT